MSLFFLFFTGINDPDFAAVESKDPEDNFSLYVPMKEWEECSKQYISLFPNEDSDK
ncbi:MAG: hypothetical protein Q4G69_07180 [Planctomycetia bacterium]|nr:hypothetical protein [Planctomycetia bacterium]